MAKKSGKGGTNTKQGAKSGDSKSESQSFSGVELKAVLNSPVVRNALAAVLASAAAALYLKKPGADERSAEPQPARGYDRTPPTPAKRSTAKKVRQKAAVVTTAVSDAAKTATVAVAKAARSEAKKAATKAVARTAKAVMAKTTRQPKLATQGVVEVPQSKPAPTLPVAPAAGPKKRKSRSDLGKKKGPRTTRAAVGAPSAMDLPNIGGTEASLLALASANADAGTPEVLPGVTEQEVSEAHPS